MKYPAANPETGGLPAIEAMRAVPLQAGNALAVAMGIQNAIIPTE